ncbi:hypothetical protein KFL_003110070 [Klebsormidium nitens]|uniref:CHHC U11-48K-type domain-containing protein n=1 Tax=Klebsormidium nitens TaxID=105231 RepID=A0A1Y1I752_KLENI|nr:hypothetical protein KFL_003110070 [Klebsormidium nitens]|eukprot:GAQ86785.1 hypothetical protein KFL_003110070 [Klebsormidium nitens]
MDQTKVLLSAASLVEELTSFLSSANATLLFASSALSTSNPAPPPLFPCPINSQHRVPATALAAHTASCQAAKGGFNLEELSSPASSFFYADAPGVVQLQRLPVDQPPRPPLPPQSSNQEQQQYGSKQGPPQPAQQEQQGLGVQEKSPGQTTALQNAVHHWEQSGGASVSHRFAAEQEVLAWCELPSPMPPEAGRLIAASPPSVLAALVQTGAAEGGVGVTAEEAEALGSLLIWQSQAREGNEGAEAEADRLARVLTAVALLRPPAGATSFLLRLWQTVLGGLLRTLPPLQANPPFVSTAQMAAARETLRDGVRLRQQREQAGRPEPGRAERLAQYDSSVQTAAAVRARRPDYRPLPDHDWLFRPHDPSQPQANDGRRSRVELLAELRDLKRRTTSYRAKKQRTPLQSARDLIELRMMQLEEAFGPAGGAKQRSDVENDQKRRGPVSWDEETERREREKPEAARERWERDRGEKEGEARRKRERGTGVNWHESERLVGERWGDDYRETEPRGRLEDDEGRVRDERHRERRGEGETRIPYTEREGRKYGKSEERKRTGRDRTDKSEWRSGRREQQETDGRDARRERDGRGDERGSGSFGGARVRERERGGAGWEGSYEAGGSRRWADDVEEKGSGRWGEEADLMGGKRRRNDY